MKKNEQLHYFIETGRLSKFTEKSSVWKCMYAAHAD